MKLEIGKFYRTRDGEKKGPAKSHVSDIYPWRIGGNTYTDDGMVYTHAQSPSDLVAEWTEDTPAEPAEIGTLKELNVQPGDMVEIAGAAPPARRFVIGDDGWGKSEDGFSVGRLSPIKFRIVSRANPAEPASEIVWGEWGYVGPSTDEDFECRRIDGVWQWRYPVPKQPVVEEITLTVWGKDYLVTVTRRDGVVDDVAKISQIGARK